jgi:hypothetical protein
MFVAGEFYQELEHIEELSQNQHISMMLMQRPNPRWTTHYVHCPHSYSGCTHLGGASNCLCELFLLIFFLSFILSAIFRCILYCKQSSKKGEIVGANILPPYVLEIVDRNSHGLTRLLVLLVKIVHADFEENDISEGMFEEHLQKSWAQKLICRRNIQCIDSWVKGDSSKRYRCSEAKLVQVTRRNR